MLPKGDGNPEYVTSMKVEIAELLSVLGNALEEILKDSKMTDIDVDVKVPLGESTRNPSLIHFVPQSPHLTAQIRTREVYMKKNFSRIWYFFRYS